MPRSAIILCAVFLASCSSGSAPKSFYEVTGNSAQRVEKVTAIIAKHTPPPTAIQDAYFLEDQAGDGSLGPSDFKAFGVIVLAPQDVEKWSRILAPLNGKAQYEAPEQPRDWWVSIEAFKFLKLYKPETLTGRTNGWVGVSLQTGHIYFFSFTM